MVFARQRRSAWQAIAPIVLGVVVMLSATSLLAEGSFRSRLDALGIPLTVPSRGKLIVVNVPAFELIAFENGVPVLRSRVVVGTPWHRTPRLETQVTSIRFRPPWRPTPSMVASGEYPDRIGPPGRNNPLGLAAARLGPDLLVHLHDTNRRELFERDYRALSHGCVRVERWDDLVAWIREVPLAEVHARADGANTIDVPTPDIPVVFGYFTAFPGVDGAMVRYDDVYGLETRRPDRDAVDTPSACPGAPANGQASVRATGCAGRSPPGSSTGMRRSSGIAARVLRGTATNATLSASSACR
jgi:hypothetical protein